MKGRSYRGRRHFWNQFWGRASSESSPGQTLKSGVIDILSDKISYAFWTLDQPRNLIKTQAARSSPLGFALLTRGYAGSCRDEVDAKQALERSGCNICDAGFSGMPGAC